MAKLVLNNDVTAYFLKRTISIEDCLIWCTEHDCSDLYIKVGERPYISRYGKIQQLPCTPISKDAWSTFYGLHVLNELNAVYVRQKLLDISVEVHIPDSSPNYGKYDTFYYRYRASFGFSNGQYIATFRMIRPTKPTFSTINYPKSCEAALREAYTRKSGIGFFTGPTGSGKSTSLAACINTFTEPGEILDNRVIITLEDPIENDFTGSSSVNIVQKELDKDFKSFGLGIKAALREHPNMIVVGECRDKEVICATVEAARTGHLVSTSFHASDVAGTISRLLYHLDNDKNLAYDLLINLNIIVSQRLVQNDNAYIVDVQYLLFTNEITRYIIKLLNEDKDISTEIDKLFTQEELLERGIAKDWSYK